MIACAGRSVAKLVPVEGSAGRQLGVDVFEVTDGFDAPLPDEILVDFAS